MPREDDELDRVWARFSDHEDRLRDVEALETPSLKRLNRDVSRLFERVDGMDIRGTQVTQVRLSNIEADIGEMKEDARSLRTSIRSAVITAAASICVQVILFVILKGTMR